MIMSMSFALLSLLWFNSNQFSVGKGWRGIVPLHSTKADVIKLLGEPNLKVDGGYNLPDVTVNFIYSTQPCELGWNVPVGTVLRILVSLKKDRPKLSELDIDLTKYKKKVHGELPDITDYINDEEGILLEVQQGEVRLIWYDPAAKDNHLKC